MNELKIIKVPYNSEYYTQVVILRQKILRSPLGLKLSKKDLASDNNEIILAVLKNNKVIACLQLKIIAPQVFKLRQMAVDTNFQNQKIGTNLIKKAEEVALKKEMKEIKLHARKTAVKFYQKLGYQIISEEFTEVGIPHYEMLKKLT